MTPKQEAKELVESMSFSTFSVHGVEMGEYIPVPRNSFAKECALIAVNKIISTLNHRIKDLDVRGNVLLDLIEYYYAVKQEIEKL